MCALGVMPTAAFPAVRRSSHDRGSGCSPLPAAPLLWGGARVCRTRSGRRRRARLALHPVGVAALGGGGRGGGRAPPRVWVRGPERLPFGAPSLDPSLLCYTHPPAYLSLSRPALISGPLLSHRISCPTVYHGRCRPGAVHVVDFAARLFSCMRHVMDGTGRGHCHHHHSSPKADSLCSRCWDS